MILSWGLFTKYFHSVKYKTKDFDFKFTMPLFFLGRHRMTIKTGLKLTLLTVNLAKVLIYLRACSCHGKFEITAAIWHHPVLWQKDLFSVFMRENIFISFFNEMKFSNHLNGHIIDLHRPCLLPCWLLVAFKLIPQGLPPVDGLGVLHRGKWREKKSWNPQEKTAFGSL